MPLPDPAFRWRVHCHGKSGRSPEEFEDAWAANASAGRFAVADGASESAFAGLWAGLLVNGFIAAPRPRGLALWLAGARCRWAEQVMGLELPWYAEMKREQGAFATLLGLSVRAPTPGHTGRWQAVAVGDTCLVQVRDGRQLRAFPLGKSAEFGNEPRLIRSRDGPTLAPAYASGPLLHGDGLLMMTDALAHWFLHAHEQERRPWEAVAPLLDDGRPKDDFAAWVEGLRARDGLRDDDVTLLAIEPRCAPKE